MNNKRIEVESRIATQTSQKLRQTGANSQALKVIEKAIQKGLYKYPFIVIEHSVCLQSCNKTDEAEEVLQLGQEEFKSNLPIFFAQSRLYYSLKRFPEAMKILRGEEVPKNNPQRIILLSQIEFEIGKSESALARLYRNRAQIQCANALSRLLRFSGKTGEALTFIEEQITNYPLQDFNHEKALCLQTAGFEKELNNHLNTWKESKKLPYFTIAISQAFRLFQYDRAIQLSEHAIELYPNKNLFFIYRIFLLSAIKLENEGLTLGLISILSEQYFDSYQAHKILSEGWMKMEEYDRALDSIKKAIELEPTKIGLCFEYVNKLIVLGFTQKALDFMEGNEHIDKQDDLAQHTLAKIYWHKGQYSIALDMLKTICSNNNLGLNITSFAIHCFTEFGLIDEALNTLENLHIGSSNAQLNYFILLAKIHVANLDLDHAITLLEESISNWPDNESLYERLCELKLAKGDIKNAEKNYSILLKIKEKRLGKQQTKHTPTMLGQQINEFKLLSHDFNLTNNEKKLGTQLRYAVKNCMLAITIIRRMYELGNFTTIKKEEHSSNRFHKSKFDTLHIIYKKAKLFLNTTSFFPKKPRRIPLKVFQFWDGRTPPEQVQTLMDICKKANTDCDYRCFNNYTALSYLKSKNLYSAAKAFQLAQSPATKADILRLALLWHEGGIYIDADDLCISPFSQHLDSDAEIYLYIEPNIFSLGNNFMACSPRLPMIEAALNEAVNNVLTVASESTWFTTGPGLVTRHFVDHYITPELLLSKDARVLLIGELKRFLAHHQQVLYKKTNKHWVKAFTDKNWNVLKIT